MRPGRQSGVRVLGPANKSDACVSIFVRRWLRRDDMPFGQCWPGGIMGIQYSTHELVRWWLQEVDEVRVHVLRLALRLPRKRAIRRVAWHDTHVSYDLPRAEADCLFDVWVDDIDSTMVIIEIQCSRDEQKVASWMTYLGATHLRHRKPVVLAILAFDDLMARWCRKQVARPLGANRRVGVRVLGPATWRRHLVPGGPPGETLRCYALCWLAGQRIAEYEQALAQILNDMLTLDAHTWRWYAATLWRIAELYAPHLKESIMNQIKRTHPFQPIFENEWAAHDRGFVKGEAQGIEKGVTKGKLQALRQLLERWVGALEVERLLAGTPEANWERVLTEAIEARVRA